MFGRAVVLVTMMALLANMVGCASTRNVRFFSSEIPENPRTKVETVRISSKVTGIVLKNREIIRVNDQGVRTDPSGRNLIATDVNGNYVEVDIADVIAVHCHKDDIAVFDETGGRIDLVNQVIAGSTPGGAELGIPLSDVCYVTGESLDYTDFKTLGIIGLVIVAGLVACALDGGCGCGSI